MNWDGDVVPGAADADITTGDNKSLLRPLTLNGTGTLAGGDLGYLRDNAASIARGFVYGGEKAINDSVVAAVAAAIA